VNNSNSRCQSLTKKGEPCRAAATEGGLCFFPANPNIADVYAGKLNPRIAASLALLMHLQLRVIEKTGFEKRLAEVERQLGPRSGKQD
jgi:hypothetical protein